jgi:hypothetical protein
MILIHRLTIIETENYFEEYLNSLRVNISNKHISKIIIFSEKTELNIPKNSKIILKPSSNYKIYDLLKYCKKIFSNGNFILANPYAIFNDSLSNAFEYLHEQNDKIITIDSYSGGILNPQSNDVYIFGKNTQLLNNNNLSSIFGGFKIDLSKEIIVSNKRPWNGLSDKIILKTNKNNIEIATKIERKIGQKLKDVTLTTTNRIKKLDILIISVNYNDYLLLSLNNNIKYFENITIITSSDDILCQKICEKFGIKCLITNVMYEDGDYFNKGKAINFGLKNIENPDLVLILDADIVITKEIDLDTLNDGIFYYTGRYFCDDYETYKKWENNQIDLKEIGEYESNNGLGYFQLFKYDSSKLYPKNFKDAGWSDLVFRDKFPKRIKIENDVIHLGENYKNWKGRKSERFIDDDIFNNLLENDNIIKHFIGIGITTKNRSNLLEKTLNNIKQYTNINAKYILIDDNSDDFHRKKNEEISRKYKIKYIYNVNNIGIAKSKNKCIENIDDCGYIFLFDDDCYPIKENWWFEFIDASEKTNCEHFSLTFDHTSSGRPNGNNLLGKIDKNGYILEEYSNPCGILLFITKNCIEKIGGFDSNYSLYGKEHVGYSSRCYNMGLTIGNFMSISNTLKNFYSYDYENKISSTLPWKDKKKSQEINNKVFEIEKNSYDYKLYKKEDICISYLNRKIEIDIKNIKSNNKYIILHNDLPIDYIKNNTTEKVKFYKVGAIDKNEAYKEYIEKNKTYIKRYKIINIENNFILSTIITGTNDMQRNLSWESDNFDYIKDWYNSIIKNELKAIVFHNTFSEETVIKYSNENITFTRIEYEGYLNPNVYRYFVYKKYLEENLNNIDNIFITDISDVVVLQNPFKSELFKNNNNNIFCGDEETILNSEWMIKHNEHLRNNIENFGNYEYKFSNHKLLNCGIIGGDVNTMISLIDDICKIHESVTISNKTKYTCDMGVFNYVVRSKYNNIILYGNPVNTRFKYYENNFNCWFQHK